MKPYHSDEFTCHWEIPFDPSKDINSIAKKMIEDAEPDDDDSLNFFKQDFEIFKLAVREIKAGRNTEEWFPIFHSFIERYQPQFKIQDAIKSLELLQAVKSKRLLKQLNLSDELDIKVHMEIIKFRNEIFNKYNISLPC